MKYYVQAKPIKMIIDFDGEPRDAAKFVLKEYGRGKLPEIYTTVSESGYYPDYLYYTDDLLKELWNERKR